MEVYHIWCVIISASFFLIVFAYFIEDEFNNFFKQRTDYKEWMSHISIKLILAAFIGMIFGNFIGSFEHIVAYFFVLIFSILTIFLFFCSFYMMKKEREEEETGNDYS